MNEIVWPTIDSKHLIVDSKQMLIVEKEMDGKSWYPN